MNVITMLYFDGSTMAGSMIAGKCLSCISLFRRYFYKNDRGPGNLDSCFITDMQEISLSILLVYQQKSRMKICEEAAVL